MTQVSQATPPAPSLPQTQRAVTAIVLAAGKGTRMRSQRHKVLHEVAGRPMLWHVLAALAGAGIPPQRTVVVIGDGAAEVRQSVEGFAGAGVYPFVLQEPQLGTGHATMSAREAVPEGTETVLVAFGDTPLLRPQTVTRLLDAHHQGRYRVTLLSGVMDDPSGYGRVVRQGEGVRQIVEDRDATEVQRRVREVNTGFCAFAGPWLWEHLPRVTPAPNGELYLTALPGLAAAAGEPVGALVLEPAVEALGINTRIQLAEAEALLRRRITTSLMEGGVSLQDPATTYVDAGVEVGADTVILANTHLTGSTTIGRGCVLGPNSVIRDSVIGDDCRVLSSFVNGATLETGVGAGPFAHLRPGTRCGRGSTVGTGSEVNRSTLGPGSKMMHFGYLGDATVGEDVNIGAGTITCNFDGERKHGTGIGAGAFVGSGTLLVAPVAVGRGALTGAGAVVTRDVAEGDRVVGVPARSIGQRGARRGAAPSGPPDGEPDTAQGPAPVGS